MRSMHKSARSAFDGDAFPIAIDVVAGFGHALEIEIDIVGNEEIKMAVAVVIDEGCAGTPARFLAYQSRGLRHVGESAVAVVAIEFVLSPIRNEEILEAVVVVIADA